MEQLKIGLIYHSGYFLGHSTVWLLCAQTLAVFDISKLVENGVEITPEFDLVGELIVLVTDIILCCIMLADNTPDIPATKRRSNVRSSPDQQKLSISSAENFHPWNTVTEPNSVYEHANPV